MNKKKTQSYNFADLFGVVADAAPDRIAVICAEQRLSYSDVFTRACKLAHCLQENGIERGDNVGLQLTNSSAYLEAFFACCLIGAVPFNINYRYVHKELEYLYRDSDIKALFFDSNLFENVAAAAASIKSLRVQIAVGASVDSASVLGYEAILRTGISDTPSAERRDDDLLIIYTGGTTGDPKGVMWPHKSLFFGALGGGSFFHPGGPVSCPADLATRLPETPQLRMMPLAPLMHGAAFWAALISLLAGQTIVLNDNARFDGAQIWTIAEKEQVNILQIVGDAMAAPLLDALRAEPDRWSLPALSYIGSGGAVFSESLQQGLQEMLPAITVSSALGATETGTTGPGDLRGDEGIMTYRARQDLAVVVDGQRLARPGETGVFARCGLVAIGYYGDKKKTAETFPLIDGVPYALGGDAARLELDGTITVLGRGSMCINTGGEKVYPEEVEQVLKAHSAVSDALVVGVAHVRWTQAVAAVVSLRPGCTVDVASLQAHCRGSLAGYKVPREIRVVDTVQRNVVGKPDYPWAASVFIENGHT